MMNPSAYRPPIKNVAREQLLAAWAELVLGARRPARPGWHRRAECGQDPLFHEKDGAPTRAQVRKQRTICAACPVVRDCLADALSSEGAQVPRVGMRGGLTAQERDLVTDPAAWRASLKQRARVGSPRGGRLSEQAQFVQAVQELADGGATVREALAKTGYEHVNPFSRRLWRAKRSDLLGALRANETLRAEKLQGQPAPRSAA
ncbi:WhiB family transcriptional regulator [Promicromonospora sp. NFX87]|uniref:WhiB family transcriptional regulator n=1 Tax=Promicromonospora sp. NFX87 TaxID=3402691 RepID=UPI003AFB666A